MAIDSSTFRSVCECIAERRVHISEHALKEAGDDRVTIEEIKAATVLGECIENYPSDPRGPSCLTVGTVADGAAIHALWGFDATRRRAILITVYRPDPRLWSDDLRKRRGRDVAEDE